MPCYPLPIREGKSNPGNDRARREKGQALTEYMMVLLALGLFYELGKWISPFLFEEMPPWPMLISDYLNSLLFLLSLPVP